MSDERDKRLAALYSEGAAARPAQPHPDADAIAAAAEGRGPEAERLRTLEHVAECASCREEFDLLRAAHTAGRQLVAAQWRVRAVGLAAAALLIAAVGIVTVRSTGLLGVATPIERGPVVSAPEHAIAIVAPRAGARASDPARLIWRAVPGATQYRVELLDSAGAVVATGETADTTFLVPRLPASGDYRWWVRAIANGAEWRSPFGAITSRR